MKRYCKNVDILDLDFLEHCVHDCLKKKWTRRDVLKYFAELLNIDKTKIREMIQNGEKDCLVHKAALYMQSELKHKELHFIPIWYKEKIDSSNHKVRRIGIQNVSQQLYDYVAAYALRDIFRRIGEYQCASIPEKGTSWGVKHIKKWLRNRDIKYSAQLDVQKCFPSIPQDRLLAMIDKYVANDSICWLVRELVGTFEQGLSIGSYLSQYLCNLYISQLYHEISERMFYARRGKQIRLVNHVLIYMDDILLLGKNRKSILLAIKKVIKYSFEVLGLQIKPKWIFKEITEDSFIDMMGFRIYRDRITIRRRVFLRIRKAFKAVLKRFNRFLTLRQAQKCISYFGIIKFTDSFEFAHKYKAHEIISKSKEVLRNESKLRQRTTEGKAFAN